MMTTGGIGPLMVGGQKMAKKMRGGMMKMKKAAPDGDVSYAKRQQPKGLKAKGRQRTRNDRYGLSI